MLYKIGKSSVADKALVLIPTPSAPSYTVSKMLPSSFSVLICFLLTFLFISSILNSPFTNITITTVIVIILLFLFKAATTVQQVKSR